MTVRSFESLRVWHLARRLTVQVYSVARKDSFARDFGLRDQVCRAAVSVMSNVAEGFERGSRKEFAHFLRIARGSAAEVRAQIYAAEDLGYLDPATARDLRRDALALSKQLASLSKHLSADGGR
jgi:four helix bundle protein